MFECLYWLLERSAWYGAFCIAIWALLTLLSTRRKLEFALQELETARDDLTYSFVREREKLASMIDEITRMHQKNDNLHKEKSNLKEKLRDEIRKSFKLKLADLWREDEKRLQEEKIVCLSKYVMKLEEEVTSLKSTGAGSH